MRYIIQIPGHVIILSHYFKRLALLGLLLPAMPSLAAPNYIYLEGVPDYAWNSGCFGTANGNLAGFWDRHGFPNFYTGPTGGGVAPLLTTGGIQSLWATQAGVDGRPANQPGHVDDYYVSYESTARDPYITAQRSEHPSDCLNDFCGINQLKWTNQLMNGECIGNIDAYAFVYWDLSGRRRVNHAQTDEQGNVLKDLQSGLKAWTQFRGSEADVFTQLVDQSAPAGQGFTFEDLKAEIRAGYPVLFFLQLPTEKYRHLDTTTNRYNPQIHGVLAYGFAEDMPLDGINQAVIVKTSWGTGQPAVVEWNGLWPGQLPARGAIGYHPLPKITQVTRRGDQVTLQWEGPSSSLFDALNNQSSMVHRYQLEKSVSLFPAKFVPVGEATTSLSSTLTDSDPGSFYRIVLSRN